MLKKGQESQAPPEVLKSVNICCRGETLERSWLLTAQGDLKMQLSWLHTHAVMGLLNNALNHACSHEQPLINTLLVIPVNSLVLEDRLKGDCFFGLPSVPHLRWIVHIYQGKKNHIINPIGYINYPNSLLWFRYWMSLQSQGLVCVLLPQEICETFERLVSLEMCHWRRLQNSTHFPIFEFLSIEWSIPLAQSNRTNRPWTGILKIVSQNKSFLKILSLVFCYINRELFNTN